MYRKTHRKNYTYIHNCTITFSFPSLCLKFHVARIQTQSAEFSRTKHKRLANPALGHGTRDRGIRVRLPPAVRNIFFAKPPGAYPPSHLAGTTRCFSRRWSALAEVNNAWSYTSIPLTPSRHSARLSIETASSLFFVALSVLKNSDLKTLENSHTEDCCTDRKASLKLL
jgi:hypothetical protein